MQRGIALVLQICLMIHVPLQAFAPSDTSAQPVVEQTKRGDNSIQATLKIWGRTKRDDTDKNVLTVALAGALRGRITVEGPAALKVDLTKVLPPRSGWLEVDSATSLTTVTLLSARIRVIRDFELTPAQLSGKRKLRLSVLYPSLGGSAELGPIIWDEIDVQIEPAGSLDTRIEPEPLATPRLDDDSMMEWIIATTAGASLLIVAVTVAWRRRSRAQAPKPSPARQAFDELDRLLEECNKVSSDDEKVHEAISRVLRRYLEDACSVPATRQTTAELEARLSNDSTWNDKKPEELALILHRCDEVKYAVAAADDDESRQWVSRARDWIEQIVSSTQNGVEPAA